MKTSLIIIETPVSIPDLVINTPPLKLQMPEIDFSIDASIPNMGKNSITTSSPTPLSTKHIPTDIPKI
jgi:hypothetical protein